MYISSASAYGPQLSPHGLLPRWIATALSHRSESQQYQRQVLPLFPSLQLSGPFKYAREIMPGIFYFDVYNLWALYKRRPVCVLCVLCWLGNAPEPLAVDEELELVAIQGIHGQLDDNRDGAVDFSESDEVSSLRSLPFPLQPWTTCEVYCIVHSIPLTIPPCQSPLSPPSP